MLKSEKEFRVVKGRYVDLQVRIISDYRVTVSTYCIHNCHQRTHVDVRDRHICKWRFKNSYKNTFTLLHEIGHIENNSSGMKRAWQEYYATTWAIDRLKEYGLPVDEKEVYLYQYYILSEIGKGRRRKGDMTGYESLNLLKYIGTDKSLEDVYNESPSDWKRYIDGFKAHVEF